MSVLRNVLGIVGLAGGIGFLVSGIQQAELGFTLAGCAALLVGVFASFRRFVCPSCRARSWVSSNRATHCIRCGTALADTPEEPQG